MNLELGRAFWQFELSGVALLPRLVTWGKVGDIEGEFWLKVWGERLLFCAAKEPQKVFAVTTPCLQSQNLVAFWRQGVDEDQFGRLVLSQESLAGTDETFTGFVFLCMEDGRRWIREWCGDEWMPQKRTPRPSSFPVWHPAWKEPTSRSLEISNEMRLALLGRPFSEAERQDCPLMWLRGSRAEWKQFRQSVETLFLVSVTGSGDYGFLRSDKSVRQYASVYAPFSSTFGQEKSVWDTLESRYFVCVGWHWTQCTKRNAILREGWKVDTRTQSAQIRLSKSPSQHEQVEAILFLKGWLQGKVPDEDVKKFLRAK